MFQKATTMIERTAYRVMRSEGHAVSVWRTTMQDSQTRISAPADAEREVNQHISAPQPVGDGPPVPARAGYDRAYRQRKRGIYVLAGVCVAFFVVVISACYIPPPVHRYRTGFVA